MKRVPNRLKGQSKYSLQTENFKNTNFFEFEIFREKYTSEIRSEIQCEPRDIEFFSIHVGFCKTHTFLRIGPMINFVTFVSEIP